MFRVRVETHAAAPGSSKKDRPATLNLSNQTNVRHGIDVRHAVAGWLTSLEAGDANGLRFVPPQLKLWATHCESERFAVRDKTPRAAGS